ncbi:MAG: hydrogenase formation protein HypD [Spirochaetes bacterium]|nr:hydrogenase formation protein HypD [Spirochaetota bacterium]
MNFALVQRLAKTLSNLALRSEVRIMEVCGTHTVEFFRTGVRSLFPKELILVDGPGCPVCVTPNEYLDRAIEIGKTGAILTTFGDLLKVPSSYTSLAKEKAKGMRVEIVYSPMEALQLAEKNPNEKIVFLSVGFETTAPAEAVAILHAREKKLKNFFVLSGNKLTPPAVKALLDSKEVHIDGFILPGHVSAIVGSKPWEFVALDYGKPCVIAGFEDFDLLTATLKLTEMITKNEIVLENLYKRVVKKDGNTRAIEIMYRVFEKCSSHWRGIGTIPESGLAIRDEFFEYDAEKIFSVELPPVKVSSACRCGELLRGLISPPECPLFENACTPEEPIGPCMVSSEGPCAAYHRYYKM